MATDVIVNALANYPDVAILRRIRPSAFGVLAVGGAADDDLLVANTTMERALALQQSAGDAVIVERNSLLRHHGIAQPIVPSGVGLPGSPLSDPASVPTVFKIADPNGGPIANAEVYLYSGGFPLSAMSAADGMATINLPQSVIGSVDFIYVKPQAGFWESWRVRPSLITDAPNILTLRPLSSFAPAAFPGRPFLGWGERIMRLDQQQLTGSGSRIGIIDSGCDNTHPALAHIQAGADFTNLDGQGEPNKSTWSNDQISHGTHCAGVISGGGTSDIRGFAPEAEIHVLKVFPGGRFDSLISALKYAIDNQLDAVNLSLGSPQGSEIEANWVERARQAGVAVVVAAGNSSGAVQFPATVPGVLAVSAFGKQGTFPDDTYHAQTYPNGVPGTVGRDGIFAPKFTCNGPEVDVCAPGVAVISSVPGGGYAAWDGTSMAAPHITGLVALLAAHQPEFSRANAPRNADRVNRILRTVVASATNAGLAPAFSGAGIPDSVTALAQGVPLGSNNGVDLGELTRLVQQVVASYPNRIGAPMQ